MTVGQNFSTAGVNDAADNADEGGFARAIGAEKGENFSLPDLMIDVFQGLKA
jgi:hypothetical protein